MLCALIMAGGQGTRFWPLSTEERPKQFLNLLGNKTMIQMTVERIKDTIPVEKIFICTGSRYIDLIREQLPEIKNENIIIEPEGRNTAPCIALSAFYIQNLYKNTKMLVLPADHLIKNEKKFRWLIGEAKIFLDENPEKIVTFGMNPTRAEVGYGYINYSNEVSNKKFFDVKKFVEKPNLELANVYYKSDDFLWNSGMFMWDTKNIINIFREYLPNTYNALVGLENDMLSTQYSLTDEISVDYGILEKYEEIVVMPTDIGWDDIGTWKAIERYKEKDDMENIIDVDIRAIEAKRNIVINDEKKVVLIGVNDTLTIETEDTIYVVNKEYMDNIKEYKNII